MEVKRWFKVCYRPGGSKWSICSDASPIGMTATITVLWSRLFTYSLVCYRLNGSICRNKEMVKVALIETWCWTALHEISKAGIDLCFAVPNRQFVEINGQNMNNDHNHNSVNNIIHSTNSFVAIQSIFICQKSAKKMIEVAVIEAWWWFVLNEKINAEIYLCFAVTEIICKWF